MDLWARVAVQSGRFNMRRSLLLYIDCVSICHLPSSRFCLLFVGRLLLGIATLASLVRAQTTSTIEGIVADQQGLPVAAAEIHVRNSGMGIDRTARSEIDGTYRVLGLPAGTYTLTVSMTGFVPTTIRNLEVTVNQTVTLNLSLKLGGQTEKLEVSGVAPLLESVTSSSGVTILPQQIEQMPINGRNYLDLLQLVPGVAINRRVDERSDSAVPILGERGGNAIFLIDGMPNSNAVDGGPAAPFDQDSILEFQVLTAGYKAEFGHGSGGLVNVVTGSGTDHWPGRFSLFHRNSVLDSSDVPGKRTPFLLRWDPSANLGGPLFKDRVFFFGSVERIRESRQLNFSFPPGTPDFLQVREAAFDKHSQLFQTRSFFKLDENLGRHGFTEQMSLSNSHVSGF